MFAFSRRMFWLLNAASLAVKAVLYASNAVASIPLIGYACNKLAEHVIEPFSTLLILFGWLGSFLNAEDINQKRIFKPLLAFAAFAIELMVIAASIVHCFLCFIGLFTMFNGRAPTIGSLANLIKYTGCLIVLGLLPVAFQWVGIDVTFETVLVVLLLILSLCCIYEQGNFLVQSESRYLVVFLVVRASLVAIEREAKLFGSEILQNRFQPQFHMILAFAAFGMWWLSLRINVRILNFCVVAAVILKNFVSRFLEMSNPDEVISFTNILVVELLRSGQDLWNLKLVVEFMENSTLPKGTWKRCIFPVGLLLALFVFLAVNLTTGHSSEMHSLLQQPWSNISSKHLHPYPVCTQKFSSDGLSLLPIIFAVDDVYRPGNSEISLVVNTAMKNLGFELQKKNLPPVVRVWERKENGQMEHIIAFRGTVTGQDVRSDLSLFSASAVIHPVLAYLLPSLPLVVIIPHSIVSLVVESFYNSELDLFNEYFTISDGRAFPSYDKQSMTNMMARYKKEFQQNNTRIILAGHSLGGAVAQVMAGIIKSQFPNAHISAVSFNSPGLSWIRPRNKFTSSDWAAKHFIHINSVSDFVSIVSPTYGNVQPIGCSKPWHHCHSRKTFICELLAHCFSNLQINWEMCSGFYTE